ncbi:hypothetical protein Tco_0883622 [Tanacetum coccineum]
MIRLRAEAASTSYPLPLPPLSPIPAPTPSPPLLLPSTNCRDDRPKVTLPPRKRLGITLGPRYEVRESSSAAAARPAGGLRADYGFVATMDREIRRYPERDVGYGITDLHGLDLYEIVPKAWRRSMDASDLAHGEVMSLRTTVLGQMSEIRELHAADRGRQAVTDRTRQQQLIQTLTVIQSLQGLVTTLQGQVTALQGQVTALQGHQGPARGPAQPELLEEAGSSS